MKTGQYNSAGKMFIVILNIMNVVLLKLAFVRDVDWYYGFIITLPLLLIAIIDVRRLKRRANTPPHTNHEFQVNSEHQPVQ
jgi:membrane protein implicated in regulation of membrane protease activity